MLEQLKVSGLYADQDLATIQTLLDEAQKAADSANWNEDNRKAKYGKSENVRDLNVC